MFAPIEACPHGLPRDEYCYKCTYVEIPSTQVLEARTVKLVLDLAVEPHWSDDELATELSNYFTQYLDEPKGGYQPATFYIRGLHVEHG